jgi:hypothetical protein
MCLGALLCAGLATKGATKALSSSFGGGSKKKSDEPVGTGLFEEVQLNYRLSQVKTGAARAAAEEEQVAARPAASKSLRRAPSKREADSKARLEALVQAHAPSRKR